jgi:signal transduction histidine kinase
VVTPRPAAPRWTLRRWVALAAAVAVAFAMLGIAVAATAITRLTDARERLADELDPAARTAQELSAALVDQETGVRGYLLGGQERFLTPYPEGIAAETAAAAELRARLADPRAAANLEAVEAAAEAWRREYAQPTVDAVHSGRPELAPPPDTGKAYFDEVRSRVAAQDTYLDELRARSRQQLADAAGSLERIAIAIGALVLIGLAALMVGLRRGVTRPVRALADQVRAVAGGDFQHTIRGDGPAELVDLGRDVDAMRLRIVAELSAVREAHERLDEQTRELARSNAELEQFAYVASHDLQEPLRKVASFTQLLAARYQGRLDDRAHQYIDFAVDGATRMQALINDLLAFSRVGRLRVENRPVDLNRTVTLAVENLAAAVEETGATITVGELPTVDGDPSLLATAFQNLIGNAIKFRRPDLAPHVAVEVKDDGDRWQFAVVDNGIGVEPEYAERIFTIFQRLHPRDIYPGTGIGLAMVRKIIEYHGGRIWLDSSLEGPGSTFRFTLPKDLTEGRTDV